MAESLNHAHQEALRNDRYLLFILLAHIPVVAFLIPLEFETGGFALLASLLLGLVVTGGYFLLRGQRACSVFFAACLMAWSAIMIQSQMGRVEMHFHIFAALALIIIYRDWLPVVAGAGVIAVHHLVLTALQQSGLTVGTMPIMLFNHEATYGMAFLHAGFVVFEAGILVFFALRMAMERRQAFQIIDVVREFGANKDLSGRLDGTGDALTARSFNGMMDQFAGLIGDVGKLSGRLRESADELTSVSDQTSRVVEEQHRQTDQAATAINQMTATVHEVAQNAQAASESASNASDAAAEGRKNVQHAVQLTEATNSALGDSSQMVTELVDKVKSIGSFVASINEISDQTNLLALNAAIEAARAGEHGRGFAVVAEEVRNLSRRTQDFTREIGSTIDDLTAVSQATFAAIEIGQTRSGETSRAVRSTGDAIRQIEMAIATVSDMNHQIAAAAEEQATASSEINDGVQRVADQNAEVVQEAERTRTMARHLEQIIGDVDGLVRDYRGV
ncbi:methyl-accepting chemotaxis protein [Marinobacter sp. F4206]|uniref:methyl-accepting chemotaxis protein n=1 Tax=Marinobacter sp. F4206 TaxID=2861777 RepID=UPI001C5EBACD|nr:methyl-accepting chemotaxis protein [Marinobacter sp. F4206]MBW4934767.1 methyl-accepting chemotaxis protein [Marinobacter sp. F4206]